MIAMNALEVDVLILIVFHYHRLHGIQLLFYDWLNGIAVVILIDSIYFMEMYIKTQIVLHKIRNLSEQWYF